MPIPKTLLEAGRFDPWAGCALGFGIKGISEELREKYSVRSAQRDAAIAEFVRLNGRQPSDNEVAILVRDSRNEKLTEITAPEVKARQYARMSAEEKATLKELHETALERGSVHQYAPAAASLGFAAEHTFERVSVGSRSLLLTASPFKSPSAFLEIASQPIGTKRWDSCPET